MRYFVPRSLILILAALGTCSSVVHADGSSKNDYTETGGAPAIESHVSAHSGAQGADASALIHWLSSSPPPSVPLDVVPRDGGSGAGQSRAAAGSPGANVPLTTAGVPAGLPSAQSSDAGGKSAEDVFQAAATGPLPGEVLVPVLVSMALSPGGHLGPSGFGVVALNPVPATGTAPLPPGMRIAPVLPSAPLRVDPKSVALDVRAHIGLPNVQIVIAPDIGLVGLPAYGWLAGYAGQDLVTSRSVNIPPVVGPNIPLALVPANDPRRQGQNFTVSVRLTPTGYTWDFGDGSSALTTSSLGAPYPQRSAIQHTYQRSSLGQSAGFAIVVTAHFAAAYQVNGGGWQALAPVDHAYRRTQVVQQVQTVLVAGQ